MEDTVFYSVPPYS